MHKYTHFSFYAFWFHVDTKRKKERNLEPKNIFVSSFTLLNGRTDTMADYYYACLSLSVCTFNLYVFFFFFLTLFNSLLATISIDALVCMTVCLCVCVCVYAYYVDIPFRSVFYLYSMYHIYTIVFSLK